jgi:hypothetical protein
LQQRRAIITNQELRGHTTVLDAEAPLSAMFGYSMAVRSLSQGRASFSMEPSNTARPRKACNKLWFEQKARVLQASVLMREWFEDNHCALPQARNKLGEFVTEAPWRSRTRRLQWINGKELGVAAIRVTGRSYRPQRVSLAATACVAQTSLRVPSRLVDGRFDRFDLIVRDVVRFRLAS